MYKRILFISDNKFICKHINEIMLAKNFKGLTYFFAISPFSNQEDFEKHISSSVRVIDLKVNENVLEIIENYDLVISIHCKQIFPPNLVNAVKCINVHPGYNPINRGWYPQVFAIINQTQVGATIHEIDLEIDHGPIIVRAFVDKKYTDTSLSLYNRIVEKEIELFDSTIESILFNKYTTVVPEVEGRAYLKKDFNSLKKLDLNEQKTTLEFINHLRAMTHGDYSNTYFIDPQTKKKIFVTINLEEEAS